MIRLWQGTGGLAAAANEWRGYEPASVFQRYELARAWWESYGGDAQLVIVRAESAGGSALLPLVRCSAAPQFEVLGAGSFDHLDVLLRGVAPLDRVRDALACIGCRHLRIRATPRASALAQMVPQVFTAADERPFSAMPVVHTGSTTAAELRQRHPRGAYRHRRLLARGGRVEDVTEARTARHLLAWALRHKRAALDDAQRDWLDPDARFEGWLAALIDQHLGGLVRLVQLKVASATAATLLFFAESSRWSLYLIAYDPEFRSDSPGAVLLWSVLERAAESHVPSVNMLTGEQWFKTRWQDGAVPLVTIDAVLNQAAICA
ncbi:MAG: GNAT family N-acetyltransferase [Candidatus Binatia bacterium]